MTTLCYLDIPLGLEVFQVWSRGGLQARILLVKVSPLEEGEGLGNGYYRSEELAGFKEDDTAEWWRGRGKNQASVQHPETLGHERNLDLKALRQWG